MADPVGRRWRLRATLLPVVTAVVLVVAPAGAPQAGAQAAATGFDAYGGFQIAARAGGLQGSYDVEGVLPLPPPLLQATVPWAVARSSTGPVTRATGAVAHPGDVLANLPALADQSAPGSGAAIPPYPLASAEHPAGPAAARQEVGTASAQAEARPDGGSTTSALGATTLAGLVEVGEVRSSARTGVEDGVLAARARSEVTSIRLLGGLIDLTGVTSDLVAASDGQAGRAEGTTAVGHVSVLGSPATLGPDGLHVDADALEDLLEEAGIRVVLAPVETTVDGAAASVVAPGIEVRIEHDGSGDGPLAQLLALLPTRDLPGTGLPGVPINTSPQALLNLLKETHVVRLALAPASADVDAAPAAAPLQPGGVTRPGAVPTIPTGAVPAIAPAEGFTTPLPTATGPAAPLGTGGLVPGRALGVLVVALAAAAVPTAGSGGIRLMHWALGAQAADCTAAADGKRAAADAAEAGSTGRGRQRGRRP